MGDIFNGTASAISEVTYSGEDTSGNIVTDAPVKLLYIDGALVWHEHTYGSWATVTDATCTTAGSKRRNCTITGCGVSETEAIAALGHRYSILKVDPTCTEQGYTLHECTRDGCLYSYKDGYMDALGHSWNNPLYSWSGYASCTATRTCANDSSHKQTSSATISSSITTAPTCTQTGVKTYYASFDPSDDWASKQTKTETLAAAGHSWYDAMYSWAEDYSSCTAYRSCRNNSSHTETATATISSKVTTAATCTTAGVKTYTATFTETWAAAQTKTESIAATGHTSSDWIVTKAATTQSAGTRVKKCTICGAILETETIAKLPALTYELDGDGYTVYATDTYISGDITIPSNYNGKPVDWIGDSAFLGCTQITGVTIPNSVTYIDTSAFEGCESLEYADIGSAVTTIADYAFSGCSSLETVNIPASVVYIGEDAFYKCDSLADVSFDYRYWRLSNGDYIASPSVSELDEFSDAVWYKFYAPVINVTLANSTAVSVAIQNKNAVALTASVKTLFDGVAKTTSISVPKNGTATATLTSSITFDNAETTAYFTALAGATSKMQCQGTGAPKKLTAPVITYAEIVDGYVEFEVQNNNSVDVTYYWSIYDDDGTEVGSGTSTVGAGDGDNQNRTVTSSLVYPLEICVYFEADGYKDSDEVFAYVDTQ